MSFTAVIGAGYGDEGKGLITDYLATPETLVVRFNGGAQAGHTVVTPDGQRHVFGHFGSGTFRGARTLLSRFFLLNPFVFVREYNELLDLGLSPGVVIDPCCEVTTPFDMLINRELERVRGSARHGSCGLGINETVTRALADDRFKLRYWMTLDPRGLAEKLGWIGAEWVPRRCQELQLGGTISLPSTLRQAFTDMLQIMHRQAAMLPDQGVLQQAYQQGQPILFEGAQGLLLDEVHGEFPHVTRSRTGLVNVEALLTAADLHALYDDPVRVVYVTRCYTTRHGAGPLRDETPGHPFGWAGPETNVTNEWQGQFRYAPLDVESVAAGVKRDLVETRLDVRPEIAVTCLDQMDGCGRAFQLDYVKAVVGVPVGLNSFGPTRDNLMELPVPV